MTRIENHHPRTVSWSDIILAFLLALIVLVGILWVDTLQRFTPAAEDLMDKQKDMQLEIDCIQGNLTRISEAVAAWPGVTEIIDETIGSLADPEAWKNG